MKKIAKTKKKEYNNADYFLLGAFIFMILVVIGLVIALIFVKNNYEKKVNISVPITEKNKYASVNINVSNKKKNSITKYRFRVRNYIGNNINKKEIKYILLINSKIKADYSIFSNNKKLSLKDNKTKIFTLKDKVKEDKVYEIHIKLKENTKKNKYINLIIGGE
ncbi:MAG: hypothetical protein IJI43_01565 [Bacilli bacterium]|nr:hypothetical protein [Bacilli bacterium]